MKSSSIIKKEINIIPEFMEIEMAKRKKMFIIVITTFLALMFCFSLYYYPQYKLKTMNEENKKLQAQIDDMKDVKDIKDKLNDLETQTKKKRDILTEANKSEVDINYLIAKLTANVPKNVLLAYFSVNGRDKVSVSYIVNNPVEATELLNTLRDLDIFEKVEMPNIPIMDRRTDVNFKLKMKSGIGLIPNSTLKE